MNTKLVATGKKLNISVLKAGRSIVEWSVDSEVQKITEDRWQTVNSNGDVIAKKVFVEAMKELDSITMPADYVKQCILDAFNDNHIIVKNDACITFIGSGIRWNLYHCVGKPMFHSTITLPNGIFIEMSIRPHDPMLGHQFRQYVQ